MTVSATRGLRLRLPATSANLGPGFDTLALALALYLEIDAVAADGYAIEASGRDRQICSRIEGNLLLEVYRQTMAAHAGGEATPLALKMRNEIPLGMGCGSSAASRLAGVALASHFGGLGWTGAQILAEAARLEGHPDNAAACWLGGFVASAPQEAGGAGGKDQAGAAALALAAISIAPPPEWRALLVLPEAPLATTASRAVLPDQYSRRDTVLNLQRVALLTAAFATGRGDLLTCATRDSIHQPYRSAVCPLLPELLPLAGRAGILGVALSGAGPSVLLILASQSAEEHAKSLVQTTLSGQAAELLGCSLALGCAEMDEFSYA